MEKQHTRRIEKLNHQSQRYSFEHDLKKKMINGKPISIGITGTPNFGRILTKQFQKRNINAEFFEIPFINKKKNINKIKNIFANARNTIKNALNKEIIHFVYSPLPSLIGLVAIIFLKLIFRKKIVIMWIGTDVLRVKRGISLIYNKIGQIYVDINITIVKWLFKELNELGIKNVMLRPSFYKILSTCDLPEKFTVLIYLPNKRFDFYRGKTCERIIEHFTEIQFLIVANDGSRMKKRPNVEFLGWVDNMNDVYCQTTVLLRIPIHDGMSSMVIEALSIGRYVIWLYPIKGGFYVEKYDEIISYLNKLLNDPKLKLNQEGMSFFHEYNKEKEQFFKSIIHIYNSL